MIETRVYHLEKTKLMEADNPQQVMESIITQLRERALDGRVLATEHDDEYTFWWQEPEGWTAEI